MLETLDWFANHFGIGPGPLIAATVLAGLALGIAAWVPEIEEP